MATLLKGDVSVRNEETRSPKRFPLLDRKQIGTIRHIGNLARQLKNDWSGMMGPTLSAADFGAYRFQLAFMSFAIGLAHFHRLPAAPGMFKNTFQRLIEKMRLPVVWNHWKDESRGGGLLNQEAGLTEGWADPIVKDNIMYSAYLQSMSLLHNVLFDDDKYAQRGALSLDFNPLLYHPLDGYHFEYDQNSINERVYWNMVESGYLGVACEPHCVFLACNQPAILGFRLHDILTGGATAEEVTQGFVKAWKEFGGFLDANGSYQTVVRTHVREVMPGMDTWSDGWTGALMHAWNPEFVKENYPRQRDRWLVRRQDGLMMIRLPTELPHPEMISSPLCGMGWLSMLASEVGDTETLNGLLAYTEKYMSPQWTKGGFHYPRVDDEYDEHGNLILMNPAQSNAFLPYARLNVPNGLHLLYSQPWGREHFSEPALTEVDFSLDIWRAAYDKESRTLLFDAALSENSKRGEIVIARVLGRGEWTLYRGTEVIGRGTEKGLIGEVGGSHLAQSEADGVRVVIDHSEVTPYRITWS